MTHEEVTGRETEPEGGPEYDHTLPDATNIEVYSDPQEAFSARNLRIWEKED